MTGLTNEQVQQRIEEGKVNANENPNTRSYKQIVRENVLTFFNFLNLALMVMVLLVGSYKNSMFMGIIVINTVIGIIQEVRAKKTLDKLAILTESKAVVLREGKKWTISTEKLVLDDILFLKTGDQVPADAKVLEGSIEVNESLLTGESDNLQKIEGDELFSGSFVTECLGGLLYRLCVFVGHCRSETSHYSRSFYPSGRYPYSDCRIGCPGLSGYVPDQEQRPFSGNIRRLSRQCSHGELV